MNTTKNRDTAAIGTKYEHQAQKLLRAHGIKTKHRSEVENATGGADLYDEDNRPAFEVKGSAIYRYNGVNRGYGFNLYRGQGHSQIDEPFTILVCQSSPVHVFIIPNYELTDAHFIAIPNVDPTKYKGRWAKFLDAYDSVK